MDAVAAVDRLEILVLIDNTTDSLSSTPGFIETEFPTLAIRPNARLTGTSICHACHGFSCLITAYRGGIAHAVLFDTGPEGEALALNCDRLGLNLGAVESIVLSHGHWDHAGGLITALDLIQERRSAPVDCYVHNGMFVERAHRQPNGLMLPLAAVPTPSELRAHGARVIESPEPQAILDDMFLLSGEIPRVTPFERGLSTHFRRSDNGHAWTADPFIIDERSLMVHVAKGMVVFTACSHAGIVNVLEHARDRACNVPLYGIVGGLHLVGANEPLIPNTIEALERFSLQMMAVGHCTGWRALAHLLNTFGDRRVCPSAVGKRYTI